MSGKLCSVTTSSISSNSPVATEVSCSGSSAKKTVIQISCNGGTNKPRALIKKVGIYFGGTSTVNKPVICFLARQVAGTPGSSNTSSPPVIYGLSDGIDTILTQGMVNFTSEPNSLSVLEVFEVHPQSGLVWVAPLGTEPVIPQGGAIGLVVCPTDSVNCHATILFEE
jgi:hypothetical protein